MFARPLDDTVIFTCDFDGKDLVKIYDEGDIEIVDSYMIPGSSELLLETFEDDTYSLFVNSLDGEDKYVLIEEWYEFYILNYSPDGKYLVFEGREDDNDDIALFIVEID